MEARIVMEQQTPEFTEIPLGSRQRPNETPDERVSRIGRPHCYDLMAMNLVMSIIATICLSAMGNRIGLEIVTGSGGRWGPGWEAGLGIATFTIFLAGVSALICVARNRTVSWVFTALSMLALFATVIATASSFHEI